MNLYDDGVLCCSLDSGVPSEAVPLELGDNFFQIEVTSADGTDSRLYAITVTRNPSPFETWQSDQFGSDSGNPAIAGELADPDGDETVNLLEYGFDLDPNSAGTLGTPTVERDGGFLTITFKRRMDDTELVYTVEWSLDLVNWDSTGVSLETLPGGSGLTEEVLGKVPDLERRKFIRVTVSKP